MDGASIENVDKIAEKFGMPLGPLALADEVGLDIGFKVSKILERRIWRAYGIARSF